ncbi:hypothetical protein BHE74_00051136 [Ensete ventricosum]|nr:hypothetical protein BHE74_00051136 [Ensete ventricosum]
MGLLSSGSLLIVLFSCHQCLSSYVLVGTKITGKVKAPSGMPDCQQGVCIGHSLDLDCKSSNELSKGLVISLRQAEKRRNNWFRTGARHKIEFKLLRK